MPEEVEDAVIVAAPPKEVTVKITLPDVITIGMWQVYSDARDADMNINITIRRYLGALALIKAGYVHIEGTDKLKELASRTAKQHTDVPGAVMGLLVRTVAFPVEASLDNDFLGYLKGL